MGEILAVIGLLVSIAAIPVSAYLGYRYGMVQQHHNQSAERRFLLRTLSDELQRVGTTMDPYRVERAFIRDPIQLATLGPLLSRGCLDYSVDEALLTDLLNLHVAISKYNDRVRVTNLAQSVAPIPDNTHHQMYQDLQSLLSLVAATKKTALDQLRQALNC